MATNNTDTNAWGTQLAREDVGGRKVLAFSPRRQVVAELFMDAAKASDQVFLIQGKRSITFADYCASVSALGLRLRSAGVATGDRVMLLGGNSANWVICFGAAVAAGAVVVLGNAWWSAPELSHAIDLVGPTVVMADERRMPAADGAAATMLLDIDEFASGAGSGETGPAPRLEVDEDDPAVVVFTSGTTGLPRGVVLSHRAVIGTLHALLAASGRLPTEAVGEVGLQPASALLSMPLFHIGGLQQIVTPLVRSTTLVFTGPKFDPSDVLDALEDNQVTSWTAVPTMLTRVLDHLEKTGREGSASLRSLSLGGAPVPETLRHRAAEYFPNLRQRLLVSYGLSESGGLMASGAMRDLAHRPCSVGRPLPSVEVRIEQPDAAGEGEILVRSPSLMSGYAVGSAAGDPLQWDGSSITSDGWLHTGDLGSVDADGFLYVTGRAKDIVIRAGENIATTHVEAVLLDHPEVREVAVLGLPHEDLGEELAAIVVVDDDRRVTVEELRDFLRPNLSYFEVPTRWRITTERLPLSAVGKVVKRNLQTFF